MVRILRSLLFFFFFFLLLFISLLPFVSISFHFFIIIIIIFSLCILIMIFPLLVSGVRIGRLCWVGQEPAVLAGGCLQLFLAPSLTGWQSSGHNMYGYNSSFSSAGIFRIG